MPAMDGIALMRAARELDADLAGVIMTGRGTVGTAVEAMKCGAVDYIIKPFTLDVLLPVLSRALNLKKLRRANELRLQQRANQAASLETANHELSLANTELDAFTRSVSHDLRQPITQIIGFAELLRGEKVGPLNEKQRELFHYIDKGGRQLLCLTEDLLRFSRLSNQPLCKVRVDVAAMVREIWDPMQLAEPQRKIEFRVGALPCVSGDRSLLRLAFTNLLSNARKFTRHKSGAMVEVTGKSAAGSICYCIRDNGAGFDMASSQQLFGIFQRLHNNQEYEGTGVGLSIVQRIVERHGGTISAQAVLGEGAAFTVALPQLAVA
jgi:signal transduction histidine kinase